MSSFEHKSICCVRKITTGKKNWICNALKICRCFLWWVFSFWMFLKTSLRFLICFEVDLMLFIWSGCLWGSLDVFEVNLIFFVDFNSFLSNLIALSTIHYVFKCTGCFWITLNALMIIWMYFYPIWMLLSQFEWF